MTEKQAQKLRNTTKAIKADLAADRRSHGGFYDDSRALRYLQLHLYVKLEDYRGGATFLRWFTKNFPDDVCYAEFLFEWALVLFMAGNTKEAEQKAFETYVSNTHIFNVFFGHAVVPIDPHDRAGSAEMISDFRHHSHELELAEFSAWLAQLIATPKFQEGCQQYVAIQKVLQAETSPRKRGLLVDKADNLVEGFSKG